MVRELELLLDSFEKTVEDPMTVGSQVLVRPGMLHSVLLRWLVTRDRAVAGLSSAGDGWHLTNCRMDPGLVKTALPAAALKS